MTDRTVDRLDSNVSISSMNPSWATYLQLGYDDADKVDERRKSVECSSIRAIIDRTELNRNSADNSTFTVYCVTITCGIHTWVVKRRYTGKLQPCYINTVYLSVIFINTGFQILCT